MKRFSERYGYVKPSEVLIREEIPLPIQNAICSCYDKLSNWIWSVHNNDYRYLEEYLWMYFLNNRKNEFSIGGGYRIVATEFILDKRNEWYHKLDMIEMSISYLSQNYTDSFSKFQHLLNSEFTRLNFAYRIVDGLVVEVTSEEEIIAIETALDNKFNSVSSHLHNALELFSLKPTGDYCNSIKESISAVEAFTREITGENTLNFKKMEEKGIILPSTLRKAFEILYGYTNDKTTGIRHALMDDKNLPGSEEALFMLVSCSTFINYLTKKLP